MSAEPSGAPQGPARRFFESVFNIRPDEFSLVQTFFLYALSIGMLFTLGTTVGDTLFLSRLGPGKAKEWIPWLNIVGTVVSIVVTVVCDRLEKKVPRASFIIGVQLTLMASMVASRSAVAAGSLAVYFALNIWLDVAQGLSGYLFFSYMGEYFTGRDARRIYPYVGGGMSVGGMLSGWAVKPLVSSFGAENLLYLCAALFACGALGARAVSRTARPLTESPSGPLTKARTDVPLGFVLRDSFTQLSLAIVVLSALVSIFMGYQLKVTASQALGKEAMAVFFGRFYAGLSMASLVFEFFIASRLISRIGIMPALAILPGLLIGLSLGFLAAPVLMMTASQNFVRLLLFRTLYLPCKRMMSLPMPLRTRMRIETLVGMVGPATTGVGSILLLVLSRFFTEAHHLSPLVAAICSAWTGAILLLRPQYRRILSESIRKRQFEPSDIDSILNQQDSGTVVQDLLKAPSPDTVSAMLIMMKGRPLGGLAEDVEALATAPQEEVAVGALGLLAESGLPRHRDAARRALRDPRVAVQGAAVSAFCRIAGEDAVQEMFRLIDAPEPEVRSAALEGLARHGGFDGTLAAYPRIDALLKSKAPADRVMATRIISRIDGRGGARVLARLLLDHDRDVRIEALLAAGRLRDPGLVPRLLDFLGDLRTRPLALDALCELPQEAAPRVAEAARSQLMVTPDYAYVMRVLLPERMVLARALGRIGGPVAAAALWDLMAPNEDIVLRLHAGHALKRLRKETPNEPAELTGWDERVDRLCQGISLMHRASAECGGPAGDLYWDHARIQKQVLLLLLALRHGIKQIRQIEAHLFGANKVLQANATELLEIGLPRSVLEKVLPLLSWSIPEGAMPGPSPETTRLLVRGHPWERAITFFHHCPAAPLPRNVIGEAVGKPDADLHQLVTTVASLKRVRLLRDIVGDELVCLAEIAKERALAPGEVLFREGDPGDALYLVCSGRVGLTAAGRAVAELKAGDSVGEEDLCESQPRSVAAVALEETRLLSVGTEDFADLLRGQPRIARVLLGTMTARLRSLDAADTLTPAAG